jgi:hypothetical protein
MRALALSAVLLTAVGARAGSDRLVLGTHDAALASALSVAVSPRGLSVVELPEPLGRVADVEIARREVAVPGTVAVVWLCDDDAAAHELCFYGADGRLVVRPVSVTSPLSPPDAAALALSVKMMLGAPPPPATTERPAPTPEPAAPPPPPAVPAPPSLPALTLEVDAGAHRPVAWTNVGLRVGLRGIFAPEALGRALGAGLGLAAGPALSNPLGADLSDVTIQVIGRGRVPVHRAWLELDLGPSIHFLSAGAGPSEARRTDFALDALAGVVIPLGRILLGARAGGFYNLTTEPCCLAGASGATTPVVLPPWNVEALLTLGFALR